jgi:hypothetical protein
MAYFPFLDARGAALAGAVVVDELPVGDERAGLRAAVTGGGASEKTGVTGAGGRFGALCGTGAEVNTGAAVGAELRCAAGLGELPGAGVGAVAGVAFGAWLNTTGPAGPGTAGDTTGSAGLEKPMLVLPRGPGSGLAADGRLLNSGPAVVPAGTARGVCVTGAWVKATGPATPRGRGAGRGRRGGRGRFGAVRAAVVVRAAVAARLPTAVRAAVLPPAASRPVAAPNVLMVRTVETI